MKLTKAQEKSQAEVAEALEVAAKAVRERFAALLALLASAADPVNESIRAYNEALVAAEAFVTAIAEDGRSAFEEKSERWQESDTGQEVDSWVQEWEWLSFDKIDEIGIVEPELPKEETCLADALRSLPNSSS